MTRIQLRPFYTPEQLAQVYDHSYDHTLWPDHVQRVRHTAEIIDRLAGQVDARTVADLSCGDGAIVGQTMHPWERRALGDYTTTGPIETALPALEPVDLFVLSETLEHLEDPDAVLRLIAEKARYLVLSTPVDEVIDENPEHYWGWGTGDVDQMLAGAGWARRKVELYRPAVDTIHQYYTFQIWACAREDY